MCTDEDLLDPATGRPFKTDIVSLMDVNGDGVDCDEVGAAICVTQATAQHDFDAFLPWDSDVYRTSAMDYDESFREKSFAMEPPGELQIPVEFTGIVFDWSQPSDKQVAPTPEQQACLQSCLQLFVRAMIPGVLLQLRVEPEEFSDPALRQAGAQNLDAMVSFSPDLSLLICTVGQNERSLPLRLIRRVRPSEPVDTTQLSPTRSSINVAQNSWFGPREHERTVILRFSRDRILRFRFEGRDQAAYFGTCMRLMAKAARAADAEEEEEESTLLKTPMSSLQWPNILSRSVLNSSERGGKV